MTRYRKWERARIVEAVIRRLDGITDEIMVFFADQMTEGGDYNTPTREYNRLAVVVKRKYTNQTGRLVIIVDRDDEAGQRVITGMVGLNNKQDVFYVKSITDSLAGREDTEIELIRTN